MDVPKVDIDSILDKIKRAQAGETVPGVTVFNGAEVFRALTQNKTETSNSGFKVLAAAAIIGIAIMPKKRK